MTEHLAESHPEGRIFAVITRADGTVEDLGCISEFVPTEDDIAFMLNATKEPRRFSITNFLKGFFN